MYTSLIYIVMCSKETASGTVLMAARTVRFIRIPTPDGGDRFDGRCEPHYHVVCTNCGNVFDLEMDDSYIQKINEDANKCFDGIIESHTTLFHGLCGECAKKLNENK